MSGMLGLPLGYLGCLDYLQDVWDAWITSRMSGMLGLPPGCLGCLDYLQDVWDAWITHGYPRFLDYSRMSGILGLHQDVPILRLLKLAILTVLVLRIYRLIVSKMKKKKKYMYYYRVDNLAKK